MGITVRRLLLSALCCVVFGASFFSFAAWGVGEQMSYRFVAVLTSWGGTYTIESLGVSASSVAAALMRELTSVFPSCAPWTFDGASVDPIVTGATIGVITNAGCGSVGFTATLTELTTMNILDIDIDGAMLIAASVGALWALAFGFRAIARFLWGSNDGEGV